MFLVSGVSKLLNINSCVKSINKQVNCDLKNLSNWLKANKISLNVGKTELVLFPSSKKQLHCDLKIKLNGKRLYETDSVRYLGIQIDKRLARKQQINHMALKLNKRQCYVVKINFHDGGRHHIETSPLIYPANQWTGFYMITAFVMKELRPVLDIKTLRLVYYAIFESHLCYASLVWAQNTNLVIRLHLLQKKSLSMFFQSRNSHTGPLFKVFKIIQSFDETALENKSLKELLPSIFNNWFEFSFESHPHDTRWSNPGCLKYPLTLLEPMVDIQCL